MQSGYRTDPIKSAKALKARVRTSKMDNAVYGSDFKIAVEMDSITNGPIAKTPSDAVSVVAPAAAADGSFKKTEESSPIVSKALIGVKGTDPDLEMKPEVSIKQEAAMKREPVRMTPKQNPAVTKSMTVFDELKGRAKRIETNLAIDQATLDAAVAATRSANSSPKPITPEMEARAKLSKALGGINTVKLKPVNIDPTAVKSASPIANVTPLTISTDVPTSTASTAFPLNSNHHFNEEMTPIASRPDVNPAAVDRIMNAPGSFDNDSSSSTKPQSEIIPEKPSGAVLETKSKEIQDAAVEFLNENNAVGQKAIPLHLYRVEHAVFDDKNTKLHMQRSSTGVRFRLQPGKLSLFSIPAEGLGEANSKGYLLSSDKYFDILGSIEKERKTGVVGANEGSIGSLREGKGLESTNSRVEFRHRISKGKLKFVLIPAYLKGNIRLFPKGGGNPLISQPHASPAFLNIVKDIIDSGTFSAADYKNTEPKESHNVNAFIKQTQPLLPSGLALVHNGSDIQTLRKRYQVLVGELSAGNHGEVVKSEMIDILRKLERLKALGRSKVMDLIKGLREL